MCVLCGILEVGNQGVYLLTDCFLDTDFYFSEILFFPLPLQTMTGMWYCGYLILPCLTWITCSSEQEWEVVFSWFHLPIRDLPYPRIWPWDTSIHSLDKIQVFKVAHLNCVPSLTRVHQTFKPSPHHHTGRNFALCITARPLSQGFYTVKPVSILWVDREVSVMKPFLVSWESFIGGSREGCFVQQEYNSIVSMCALRYALICFQENHDKVLQVIFAIYFLWLQNKL